ncbi:AtpZ/AtpI family protein [Hyphomicrobium sp.]|uniref:AtpZ/AtpI family protein n=1 Tax=Hyphomicrobium sp. TaxID=82 RepID=UPI003F712C6A
MSTSSDDEKPARGEITPEDRDAFKKRASDLGARLEKVKAEARAKRGPEPDGRARGAAMGQAMKIAIELVVGIAVGGFIGKILDDQFGTAPWLMIVFLMLGFAAGLMNIIRTARRLQAEAEPMQRSAKAVPDDDEEEDRK